MKTTICKCKVCKEKLIIEHEIHGGHGHARNETFSSQGVSIKAGVWFCNKCWREILEYDRINR